MEFVVRRPTEALIRSASFSIRTAGAGSDAGAGFGLSCLASCVTRLLISASTIDSTEGDVSASAAAVGAFIGFS
jgi:hypothetical protein